MLQSQHTNRHAGSHRFNASFRRNSTINQGLIHDVTRNHAKIRIERRRARRTKDHRDRRITLKLLNKSHQPSTINQSIIIYKSNNICTSTGDFRNSYIASQRQPNRVCGKPNHVGIWHGFNDVGRDNVLTLIDNNHQLFSRTRLNNRAQSVKKLWRTLPRTDDNSNSRLMILHQGHLRRSRPSRPRFQLIKPQDKIENRRIVASQGDRLEPTADWKAIRRLRRLI